MAWTAPRTWVVGEILTASNMNIHVRDDLLQTAPALITTAGDIVQATGANAMARLGIGSALAKLRVNSGGTAAEWAKEWIVHKTADQVFTNDAGLQDIVDLFFAVAANEKWVFEIFLFFVGYMNSDIQLRIIPPSGTTRYAVGNQAGALAWQSTYTSYTGGAMTIAIDADTGERGTHIFGIVENGATPGDVYLQCAQAVAQANELRIRAGSWLKAYEIA